MQVRQKLTEGKLKFLYFFNFRKIFLNWATQRERPERRRERSRSNDNSSRRRREEKIPTPGGSVFTVYVGNLSFKTRERSIEEFFGDCGKIADIRIAKSQDGKVKNLFKKFKF
jgi:RNA recognition motif-containing protein